MNLPRTSYYYKPKPREISPEDQAIIARIEEVAEDFATYGYRKITAQLRRDGIVVNRKKVQRIMREKGLFAKKTQRFVKTTDSNHSYPVYPNLIKDLNVTDVNQVWVADITYIRIVAAFVYLAVILDLYSRKAIGYAISRSIDTDLSLAALQMAIETRNPRAGLIHHSDQGVQYAAHNYVDVLKSHEINISMSRKGNPYDNAFAESFMKTIKTEEVYLWEYRTLDDVQRRIAYFIEDVYNQKRLHASLDYMPPNEFEAIMQGGYQDMDSPGKIDSGAIMRGDFNPERLKSLLNDQSRGNPCLVPLT
jgi:transposase InsO family protein